PRGRQVRALRAGCGSVPRGCGAVDRAVPRQLRMPPARDPHHPRIPAVRVAHRACARGALAEVAAHGALPRRWALHVLGRRGLAAPAVPPGHAGAMSAGGRRPMPYACSDLDEAVAWMLEQLPREMHIATPLGIGKPHRLLNALYARVAADASRPMSLYTALSLDPPRATRGLEGRFMAPFVARHFGADFPRLAYV